MKPRTRWSIAILLGLASGGAAPARGDHALSPLGPLGHWKGDDGATDASGNGHSGTCSAGAVTSKEVPKTRFANPGSLQLDGMSGIVSIPDAPALRITGDLTIAFWKRKTATVKDWVRLVGKGNGAQRNFGIWEYPDGDGRLKFQIYSAGGQSVLELDSPAGVPLDAWAHVVCTVSVNAAAMYLNGVLVANGTRNGEPGTSADPLTLGHAGFHAAFTGLLDDVRIYDRALSMGEIVYLAGGQGPPAEPTALAAVPGPGQVSLRWTASATAPPPGTATVYVVRRSTTPDSAYVTVARGLTSTSFQDTGVEAGKPGRYVVTAVNVGGESVPSNEAAATPSR